MSSFNVDLKHEDEGKLNNIIYKLFEIDILKNSWEEESLFSRKIRLNANDVIVLLYVVKTEFKSQEDIYKYIIDQPCVNFNTIISYLQGK